MSFDDSQWRKATEAESAARSDRPDRARQLDLLTVEQLCKRPRPRWLIRNLLQDRGLGVIYGEPGSGKTFLTLDMGAAIARGTPWMGLRARRGGVVYVACEGALRNRVEAYLRHHRITPRDLGRLRVLESAVNLIDDDADLEPLIESIREVATALDDVLAVVIDTLNRAMPGGNENAPDDMGRMIAAAASISAATGAAVIFVHHAGKDASKGSRGHSSLKGAADLEVFVTSDNGDRCAAVTKVKDGEPGQRYGFRLESVYLGLDDDPEAEADERVASCVVVPVAATVRVTKRPRQDVALEALREALHEHGEKMPGSSTIPAGIVAVTLDRWLFRWRLRTGDDYATELIAAAALRRERLKLIAATQVTCSGRYVWLNS